MAAPGALISDAVPGTPDARGAPDSHAFEISSVAARRLESITRGSPLLRQVAMMTAVEVCLLRNDATWPQVLAVPPPGASAGDAGPYVVLTQRLSPTITFRDALLAVRQAVLDVAAPAAESSAGDGSGAAPAAIVVLLTDEASSPPLPPYAVAFIFSVDALRVHGAVHYDRRLFDGTRMARFARHVAAVLEAALRNTTLPLHAIPIVDDEERRELLRIGAGESLRCSDETVWQQFRRRAAESPHLPAVATPAGTVSYGDLRERADRLTARLLAHGVRPEDRVGILLERGPELVAAIIGAAGAGAAYVPLDPEWPAERLAYMIRQSGARAALTSATLKHLVPETLALEIDASPALARDEAIPAVPGCHPDAPVYVIYTSGSTGQAKGVAVTHRALALRVAGMVRRYGLVLGDRILQFLSPSTDAFGEELYPALAAGATLYMHPRPAQVAPDDLVELIRAEEIGILHLPATYWAWLATALDASGRRLPSSLRLTIVGGEAAPPACVLRWLARTAPGSAFVNAYGPTEATITATTGILHSERELEQLSRLPVGVPLPDTRVYLLDESLGLVPAGGIGEIYIGGAALARGYLNDPAATASRFLPDPFASEGPARMYRTGDRGSWLPDGRLDFHGRLDEQIKLRGHRIEPGEIESALNRHPGVHQGVVTVRGEGEHAELLACLVPDAGAWQPRSSESVPERDVERALSGWMPAPEAGAGTDGSAALTHASLAAHLRRTLPEYMIPSSFRVFDAFPLTPSGKVDRRALVGGVPLQAPVDRSAPRDSLEAEIHQIWRDVLNVATVGIREDFFAVGGHSLRAIALAARLEQAFGSGIPVRLLFEKRTIEQQAAFIRQEKSQSLRGCLVPLRPTGSLRPVFLVHPGGGLVQVYTDLVAALDPQHPVYGLQSYGFGAGEVPMRRVEEMAARYLDEIRTVQPAGPYQLAGLSLGCVVVYEMAQQLAAMGETVSFLALLDSGPVSQPVRYSDEEWQREMEAWEGNYPARRAAIELGIDEAEMYRLPREERVKRYLTGAQQAGIVPRDLTLEQFQRFVRVFGSNVLALYQYEPRPYAGSVMLVRTALRGDDETLGWGSVAGNLTIHELPGTHMNFFRQPYVDRLAALFQQHLGGAAQPEAPAPAAR